jgi:hypothetical protein
MKVCYLNPPYQDLSTEHQPLRGTGIELVPCAVNGDEEVANHALALCFAVHRRILAYDRNVRNGRWGYVLPWPIYRLSTLRVGVPGLGRIGTAFAKGIQPFVREVIAFDPFLSAEQFQTKGIHQAALPEIFETCDIISLHLTIVTNNVAMLSVLPAEAVEDVYLLGGQYRINLAATVGPVGFSSGSISVDTAVLGVSGLTATDGLSTTRPEEASMQAQMIACASRTIIVADASKFGHNTFAQIAPLSAIDALVTDAPPPPDLSQALSQANVEVIVAPP